MKHQVSKMTLNNTMQYHNDDSRAFLIDPMWPRNDHAPSLAYGLDKRTSPRRKVELLEQIALESQAKAEESALKLQLVQQYKQMYGVSLHFKMVERLSVI
jgi:hypothetical protein